MAMPPPEMLMDWPLWDSVMSLPPYKVIDPPVISDVAPAVLPATDSVMLPLSDIHDTVMFGLVEFWLRLMPLPATKPNAVDDAVLSVPDDVPPATDPIVVNTDPPAPGAGALMVILGEVDTWLRVMFAPATSPNAVEDAVLTVPDVAPAPAAIVWSID